MMNGTSANPGLAILITREGMGHAEPELQQKLIGIYLKLILENGRLPGAICFYAEGVKLVIEGSPVLEQLRQLEILGVHLVICQTCVNYYGLQDRVRVGVIGGMPDIIAVQWKADKVITL